MSIESILRDNDLISICERDGAIFRKTGRDLRSKCPIHRGENPSGFAVYDDGGKQHWKCFTGDCGNGDIIDYVIARDRVDFKRAYEILGGKNFISPEETSRLAEERRIKAEEYEKQKRDEYHQALEELWKAKAWETYYRNLDSIPDTRALWSRRGVPSDFQDFWQLGYCPNFTYYTDAGQHISPSLTIPIFTGKENPFNIRHRILNPFNPNDKYRPDRPGLKSLPFVADAFTDEHECYLVVEGEIKAMVTYIHLDSMKWQVFGIPGKEQYRELCKELQGKRVWFLFDPDAEDQARAAASMIPNSRIISLQMKIDDAILGGYLNKNEFRYILKMAEKA